jgi:parvulin-like peptidyl-prolyl isomerase
VLKKIYFIFIFIQLSCVVLFGELDDTILVQVGSHSITTSEFSNRYSALLFKTDIKDNLKVRESVLNNMINEILLCYYDSNDKILNDPAYLKEAQENRMRTILAYLKEKEVYSKITVTEQEVRQAYSRVNEKLAARHLFAKTKEEAEKLYELVKIGVDFDTLAKQVFTDSVLQNNGGYLGYFTWGDMDPAFEDAAYSLNVGEISKPVKTAYGYSIIKLEDRISNPLLTESEFQSKKFHLIDVIKMRKKEPYENEYLNSLLDESELKFNDKNLEKILSEVADNSIESGKYGMTSPTCVEYKNKTYTQSDIENKISELPSYHKSKINSLESLKETIKGILLNDILYKIAVSKGYDTTMVVLDRIDQYNTNTFLKYKKDEIIFNAQLPDSVLNKYYRDNISTFSSEPELNLQEILLQSKELADSVMNLINEDGNFGELAKKYSLRKWSAENEGVLGYAPASKFGSYKDLFWNSKIGDIIGPLEIEGIYGIFRLLGKEDSKPYDFNTVKDEVLKDSQLENQTEILQNYLNVIQSKVQVKINEELLQSIVITG